MFSNLRALSLVREQLEDTSAENGGDGTGIGPASERPATAAAAAASTAASTTTASANPPAAPTAADGAGAGASAPSAPSAPSAMDEGSDSSAANKLGAATRARLTQVETKLVEVGACVELMTCIVSNIWDFEKLGTPVATRRRVQPRMPPLDDPWMTPG